MNQTTLSHRFDLGLVRRQNRPRSWEITCFRGAGVILSFTLMILLMLKFDCKVCHEQNSQSIFVVCPHQIVLFSKPLLKYLHLELHPRFSLACYSFDLVK